MAKKTKDPKKMNTWELIFAYRKAWEAAVTKAFKKYRRKKKASLK